LMTEGLSLIINKHILHNLDYLKIMRILCNFAQQTR